MWSYLSFVFCAFSIQLYVLRGCDTFIYYCYVCSGYRKRSVINIRQLDKSLIIYIILLLNDFVFIDEYCFVTAVYASPKSFNRFDFNGRMVLLNVDKSERHQIVGTCLPISYHHDTNPTNEMWVVGTAILENVGPSVKSCFPIWNIAHDDVFFGRARPMNDALQRVVLWTRSCSRVWSGV